MSKYSQKYLETIEGLYNQIETEEQGSIKKAADLIAESVIQDSLVHVIGTGGHSNMAAEELFWRAGGLACINPLLDAGIQLVHGAKHSNVMERTPGYAKSVLDYYGVKKGEVIIIVNAYGINSMTIETAMEARTRGLKVIGITSESFSKHVPDGHPSRHPSNKNLFEIVDVYINNHLPLGDAIIEVDGFNQKIAPTSTLLNVFTVNLLIIEVINILLQRGFTPPVWVSANMPGGDEANKKWEEKYLAKIKHLK